MTPRHTEVPRKPPSPAPRVTLTPKPFAPALSPRKADGHPGFVALVMLLALAAGAGAGWFFFLRPRPAPEQLPAAAAPALKDSLTVADTTWLAFDRVADTVTAAVTAYGQHSETTGATPVACTALSDALIRVEDAWTTYNIDKKQAPPLDTPRATRDVGLYSAVDSVERHFDRSGCARP